MSDLPEDVGQFIRDHVDSVELLRVLMALRANPDRAWKVNELSIELRSSQSAIRRRVAHLLLLGLAIREAEAFRYGASADDDVLVGRVLDAYRERRARVIRAIFSDRSDPLQSFSDAFKFGKRRDDS